ncbi:glycoside hydrolase family 127 protein [Altericroceibacterium spongiae]|uniref:Glycoside hydrolase family 127 protein n=2 Tax=Altericroceibacterium spongiae TaxID=2320269 RepID=A0A420EAG3_9SPHN|nr:glycoside hydrolase family 127 protein [Altericroceibacterium spongiae]
MDRSRVQAVSAPLRTVRLAPSPFLNAVERNRDYLLSLEPDRFLHNFHKSAGFEPKGEVYGGWEARGIAGHSLGHYMSACSLAFAQTGDARLREKLRYTISELARIQAAHGDGYAGGTTVERDGEEVDGKIVFEEVRRGEIHTGGFDVNGGWVPLYTYHKVHAGLIDAWHVAGLADAKPVMLGVADYLGTIVEGLDDEQIQKLLIAEYGGLNDSYALTYELTGDKRWLAIAEKIHDNRILDPLARQEDNLPGLHANTQIPKIIGLARLYELTGRADHQTAASFFFNTVVDHHSYVIGGNSDREHFGPPDVISPFITDRTCEACNSYNMLKLARHLYGWQPDAALFDFYEKVHLNHILAHQHPESGMFAYFMPLGSGSRRTWSTPEDSFWCCVGSGMESHSKHGDSIYWHDGEKLLVNLYIPSKLDWDDRNIALNLETGFPQEQDIALTLRKAPRGTSTIALRIPGWSENPSLSVNGEDQELVLENGYALLHREWQAGDRIELSLPMQLTMETTPDDPNMVAFLNGPLVLAANLGPASQPYEGLPPALVTDNPLGTLNAGQSFHHFHMAAAGGATLNLAPFYQGYDNRSAVYFPSFTKARWAKEEAALIATQQARAELAARTVDDIRLGEQQPETDHHFATNNADLLAWEGRSGRQAWWGMGNYLEFDMAVREGPMVLRALYWGEEIEKNFTIAIDGQKIAEERRPGPARKEFVAVDYPIPENLTRGKDMVRVRFETQGTDAPVYEVRMLDAQNKRVGQQP